MLSKFKFCIFFNEAYNVPFWLFDSLVGSRWSNSLDVIFWFDNFNGSASGLVVTSGEYSFISWAYDLGLISNLSNSVEFSAACFNDEYSPCGSIITTGIFLSNNSSINTAVAKLLPDPDFAKTAKCLVRRLFKFK